MSATREKQAEYNRIYYQKNKDTIIGRSRKYYEDNKDRVSESNKNRHLRNREKILKQQKEYYQNNREARQESNKRWFEANREKYSAYQKKWREDNRERLNKRRRERFANDPLHNLRVSIRNRNATVLRRDGYTKRSKTTEILGCDWPTFKAHIESQFTEGMDWSNRDLWHLDHIIPLASATSEKHLLDLCHYTNIQPLWASDNLRKSRKIS